MRKSTRSLADFPAADHGGAGKFGAQDAKLQIDAFLAVVAFIDTVQQRRQADAFTGAGDDRFVGALAETGMVQQAIAIRKIII